MLLPTVETLMSRFRLSARESKLQKQGRDVIGSEYATELTQFVIHQVLVAIGMKWTHILELSSRHMDALEDRVYDAPADELHTVVLWRNAAQWAKMKKLVNSHITCVLRLDHTLSDVVYWVERNKGERATPVLEHAQKQFEGIEKSISDDLVARTNHLSDLARPSHYQTMRSSSG